MVSWILLGLAFGQVSECNSSNIFVCRLRVYVYKYLESLRSEVGGYEGLLDRHRSMLTNVEEAMGIIFGVNGSKNVKVCMITGNYPS